MPRKAGVVKTYGRHKFRTVKSQSWLSPEGDCHSPAQSYDRLNVDDNKGTHRSLNIFKPKSSVWSKPSYPRSNVRWKVQNKGGKSFMLDSSPESDKENISVSLLPAKEISVNSVSPRSSNSTKDSPFSDRGTTSSTQRHTKLTNGEPNYPYYVKNAVVLASDTPEDAAEHNHSFEEVLCCVEDSVYGRLSFETSGVRTSETPQSAGSSNRPSSGWESSFTQGPKCGPPIVMPCGNDPSTILTDSSRGKETGSNSNKDRQNGKNVFCTHISPGLKEHSYRDTISLCESDSNTYSDLALHSRSGLQQVTSTPIFVSNGSKSNSQCSSLRDDGILLDPLQITPTEYDCGMAEETGSEHKTEGFSERSNSRCSCMFLSSHQELRKTCTSSEDAETSQKNTTGNPSVRLKECVVSLKKLSITPLIWSKQIRKYPLRSSASDVTPTHISASRRSHLSFAEALTPVKKITQTSNKCYEEEETDLSAFEKVLLECGQDRPVNLMEFLEARLLDMCVKIGEGVYGEVFRVQGKNGEPVALKIIPVEGDFLVNGEPQKSFEEILSEIVISKELSSLGDTRGEEVPLLENMTPSFIRVQSVTCCQGKYPMRLIQEWDRWNKSKSSENDRPDIFPGDQYFIVFEFSHGGEDLESFDFSTQSEAWSVLHQTALGLAVAENALEFEHRDLHWGNVLICRTENDFVESRLLGEKKMVASHGVHVSLIDFTLSRLTKDGVTVFCNLDEDKSLFRGRGDYQFDIYRLMKKSNQNDWENFSPHTNVLWLHYLADKMLKKKTYARKDRQSEASLRRFLRQARKISSATEIVQELFD